MCRDQHDDDYPMMMVQKLIKSIHNIHIQYSCIHAYSTHSLLISDLTDCIKYNS